MLCPPAAERENDNVALARGNQQWQLDQALLDLLSNRRGGRYEVREAERLRQASRYRRATPRLVERMI